MSGVSLLETGLANSASVIAAFTRLGVAVERLKRLRRARRSTPRRPGCRRLWRSHRRASNAGADGAARRAHQRRPTLGICLGLQLFGRGSDGLLGAKVLGVWRCRQWALSIRW